MVGQVDDFSKHELLDRAFLMLEMFNLTILESKEAVLVELDLWEHADKLSEALFEFYQLIGKKTLV